MAKLEKDTPKSKHDKSHLITSNNDMNIIQRYTDALKGGMDFLEITNDK